MSNTVQPLIAIFVSKDRAFQLDGALRSFFLHCTDSQYIQVHALVAASTPRHASLYRILELEHPGVNIHWEQDFKSDLIAIVQGSSHVLFVVDDTIFFAKFCINTPVSVLCCDDKCLGFSLRLGRNTHYCYTLDAQQALPQFRELTSGIIAYYWPKADHDFNYALEVSSSLYRTIDVLPLLERLPYSSPNTLERELAKQTQHYSSEMPLLACYERSVAVSVPINVVQQTYKNRVGGDPLLTAEVLAEDFARGDRLDIAQYLSLIPEAAHKELPLFRLRDSDIPAVSVVIPCYRQAHFLADSVASVVAQTFTDWDLTIVDDGSPDETESVARSLIQRYSTCRIRLLRKKNGGLASARNAGIATTRGRYVLPLDADDMLDPSFLEKTVKILEQKSRISIVYTDQEWFGGVHKYVRTRQFNALLLPATNIFGYCSLYRREVWEAVGGYNSNMHYGYEDWDFWVGSVECNFKAIRLSEPLFRYRIRENSMIAVAKKHHKELLSQMRHNHPKLYRPWMRITRFALRAALALPGKLSKISFG